MLQPALMAVAAALLFGTGTVVSRLGLRYAPPRVGASISVPATALMFWALAPWLFSTDGLQARALLIFAIVGAFFPAFVTILNFEATRRMGPTISSSVLSTSSAFAVLTAVLFLAEPVTVRMVLGTSAIIAGVVVLSGGNAGAPRRWATWVLLIPLAAAVIRGLAQTAIKGGLSIWPQPYMATLVGYTVAATVVTIAGRPAVRRLESFDRRALPVFAAVGLCNGSALFLSYAALADGPVSVVAPIVTTAPVFTLLISHLFVAGEKADARIAAGVLATVIGIVVLLTH